MWPMEMRWILCQANKFHFYSLSEHTKYGCYPTAFLPVCAPYVYERVNYMWVSVSSSCAGSDERKCRQNDKSNLNSALFRAEMVVIVVVAADDGFSK